MLLRTAIADIRRLVHGLRPPALDELGLVGAVQRLAERCGTDGGLRVDVDVSGELPALPAAVEVAAYRIAVEAVTNAVRHAGASRCDVSIRLGDELVVEVADDGVGLAADHRQGVGLASMRERAEELGGVLSAEAVAGRGTRVRAQLPLVAQ